MGLLDRFRGSKNPPRKPRGESGRFHTDGFLDLDEANQDLVGLAGLEVFDKMYRQDADVRRIMALVVNPIAGATWRVEPAGGEQAEPEDEEAAQFVEWALLENMRPHLPSHLGQALRVYLRAGFGPFEIVWERTEWQPPVPDPDEQRRKQLREQKEQPKGEKPEKAEDTQLAEPFEKKDEEPEEAERPERRTVIVPASLDLRLPRSIFRWNQDGNRLKGLEQLTKGGNVDLPAENLVYYRHQAEGDNWEGQSLLRPAYKHWYYKDAIERVQAMGIELQGMGVPTLYPPADASDSDLDEMEEVLGSIRANHQSFLLMPGPAAQFLGQNDKATGWHFEIVSPDGSVADAEPALKYHSDKIAATVVAEFMRLGQEGEGARATADVQQDPFLSAVENLAGEVEDVLNEQLVPRLVALNFDVEEPPRLIMEKADSTSLTELGGFVKQLSDAGAIHTDYPLEDFLRDLAGLPAADPEQREQQEAMKAKQAEMGAAVAEAAAKDAALPPEKRAELKVQPKPGEPPKGKALAGGYILNRHHLGRQDRELRSWENAMLLDEVEATVDEARGRFEAAGRIYLFGYAREAAEAVAKGNKRLPKPPPELEQALASELADLYRFGRETVARELQAQREGRHPSETSYIFADPDDESTPRTLLRRAAMAAKLVAEQIVRAVERLALRDDDLGSLIREGERAGGAALRAEGQVHAMPAVNEGRAAEAGVREDEVAGVRYTSILDANRCDACKRADDDVLRALDDPARIDPPNPACEGWDKCRCMNFYTLKDEAPSDI